MTFLDHWKRGVAHIGWAVAAASVAIPIAVVSSVIAYLIHWVVPAAHPDQMELWTLGGLMILFWPAALGQALDSMARGRVV